MDNPMIESEAAQLGRAGNSVQAAAGAAGVFLGAKVHLGQASTPINPGTPYATLSGQEATYDGYAAQAITWGPPTTAADGTVEILGTTLLFTPTGAVVNNAIWNLWISNGGSSVWYYAGPIIGGPLPMASALDTILVTVRLRPAVGTIVVTIA